jgi:hypothetical protein
MIYRLAIACILLTGCLHAQINLNTSIPAPQVKGIVQPVNGGLGVDSSSANGCPKVTAGVWTINSANCGGSSTPLTITSFTGCSGSLELGATVSTPTCSATYTGSPTSAAITNTDGVSSPTNLSSPFTSGTISGSFSHSTTATTTFTLTAVGSSTQTATQAYTWKPRIFSGLGTAGATSTVTASGTTAVLSNSNVLASAGLGAETVGQTFGPFAPSGQVIYLLLTGSSHTFTDVCSGFPLPFNAPISVSFVNINGVTVPEYLYQTTNPLTGSCFNPRISS